MMGKFGCVTCDLCSVYPNLRRIVDDDVLIVSIKIESIF